MIDHALQLASRGWRVFPCHTTVSGSCSCGRDCGKDAGKHPRIKAWQTHATADPAQIERWWKKWPQANIGLATGSGLIVLDLDGAAEAGRFASIAKPHGGLPPTLVAQTGRGFHIYLAGNYPTTRKVDGLLVRGTGGYVIAPNSLHASGKRYAWVEDRPIAPAPEWFLKWLEQGSGLTDVSANAGSGAERVAKLQVALPPHLAERQQILRATASSGIAARALKSYTEQWTSEEESRVRSALQSIPASCTRDDWLKVGMALHGLGWERPDGTDAGFEIWLAWSETGGDKFQGVFDLETRWRSFGRRGGVGLGSLFHIAAQYGVQPAGSPGPSAGPFGAHAAGASQPGAQGAAGPFGAEQVRAAAADTNGHAVPLPAAFNLRFDRDKAHNIKPTCPNTRIAIGGLGLECNYDTFHDRFEIGGRVLEQWAGELADSTVQRLRTLIHREFHFDPGTVPTHDAAVQECLERPYDPVCNYLQGLVWDGVPRLATWLHTYLGAQQSELNAQIGRLSLVAAVRRATAPGTKFDQIIVLEGEEGRNKSTAIQVLAGAGNFSDQSILLLDDRAQQEAMQGVWLYEIADLAGMGRTDVERIKAFASRDTDRARPAYGRSRQDKPRRCVFFATTNDDSYLKSQTGNRRFWPVRVGHIDIPALKRDRNQLWAEAVEAERLARSIFLPENLWGAAREQQELRREVDPWEFILENVEGKQVGDEYRILTRDLLEVHLRLASNHQTGSNLKRMSGIMQRFGWERAKLRDGDKILSGYRRKG